MNNLRRTFSVLLLLALGTGIAPAAEDVVASSMALAKAFETAWNTHDMDPGLRKLVTNDIDWVSASHNSNKQQIK